MQIICHFYSWSNKRWHLKRFQDEEDHKITLFPTRLREFEEKNNLVFNHFLGAKKDLRRNSETPCFGDQYTRRASCTEDLIDDDDQMYSGRCLNFLEQ